jgi:hypothetical protein
MKPKHVHRGVSKAPKLSGSADTSSARVGKIARIHRNYRPGVRRQRSRGSRSSKDRNVDFRQYILYSLVGAGALLMLGIIWVWYGQKGDGKLITKADAAQAEVFRISPPTTQSSVEMMREFLDAESPSGMEGLVHLRDAKLDEIFSLIQETKTKENGVKSIEWAGTEQINDLSLEMIQVTFSSGAIRYGSLTYVDQKRLWLIDAESFTYYLNKPWREITGQGNCHVKVRATATPDGYYNGVFSDEKEWFCLGLQVPGQEGMLYGYLRMNSDCYHAMAQIYRSGSSYAIIADLSRDSEMEPKQYEINKIIAHGWVETDVEFSSLFSKEAEKPNSDKDGQKLKVPSP